MIRNGLRRIAATAVVGIATLVITFAWPSLSSAQDQPQWDQERLTRLAAQLHETVKDLRQEVGSQRPHIASLDASGHYRLRDDLRLIASETSHLHQALASGATRDETRPAFSRLASLRRDCADEMRKLYLGEPVLEKVKQAGSIVREMAPYYGFDPSGDEHQWILERR
jgi:hypothetical protein